jgi:predicted RNase H-like HicB family nuclease
MKKRPERELDIPVVIEKDGDGYYAFCPTLQGCYTQADTYEELMGNLADAVKLHIEDRLEEGEEVEAPENVSLTSIKVKVSA